MPKVMVDDVVIAESDDVKMVEGNPYFPPDSLKEDYFTKTDHHTLCHWKGDADYYTIEVNGKKLENAAWTYPEPISERAEPIKDYVAFYGNMVTIV